MNVTRLAPIAAALLLAAGCAGERRISTGVCTGICGRVIDAETRQAIPRFTVALFAADPGRVRPMVQLPKGYPVPPGPTIETMQVESPEGKFRIDAVPAGGVYVGVSAPGYRPHETGVVGTGGARLVIELQSAGPTTESEAVPPRAP